MSFEKDLRKAVESIDIPEELLPVNIEAMLRNADRSAQKIQAQTLTVPKRSRQRKRTVLLLCVLSPQLLRA